MLGLALPWAGRNSDNVRTAAGVSALGAVVGVVFIGGAVCITRLREPSTVVTVGTGAAATVATAQTWSRFRDWYGDDVRLVGPTVVIASAVVLVGIGVTGAFVTRHQENEQRRGW